MNRKSFINELKKELKYYKKINAEEVIYYYDEMIQDAVDEGENESIFIEKLGSVETIMANIIGDQDFIKDVKKSNNNSLGNIVNNTVRIVSLIAYYFALAIMAIVYGSIFISGLGLIAQSGVYFFFDSPSSSDQLVLTGLIIMGIGIAIIGFALMKSLAKTNNSIRLFIIRKTKQIYRNKGEKQ